MLDEQRPDIAYVCVPPSAAVAVLERLVDRGIPFLTEKPLAATDADGPARIAAARRRNQPHCSGRLPLPSPAGVGRGPRAARRQSRSGSSRRAGCRAPRRRPGGCAKDRRRAGRRAGDALVRPGPVPRRRGDGRRRRVDARRACRPRRIGPRGCDRRGRPIRDPAPSAASSTPAGSRVASVEVELAAADLLITIRRVGDDPGACEVVIEDGGEPRTIPPERDPYEVQAEAFLDAVEANDPSRVFSTYADALETDRLTRAVVAATGRAG